MLKQTHIRPSRWRSFIRGYGSLLDYSPLRLAQWWAYDSETDEQAIAGDWQAVGDDLRFAIREYDRKTTNTS